MRRGYEKGDRAIGQRRCLAALAALALAIVLLPPALASPANAAFGFKALGLTFTEEDGTPATQAGSHPYAWTTTISLNQDASGKPEGSLRDLRIHLPAGLIGTPTLVPRCPRSIFLEGGCPADAIVGQIALTTFQFGVLELPVYNLRQLPGAAAELGFGYSGIPALIVITVDPRPPYALTASLLGLPSFVGFSASTLTLYGAPGGHPFLTLPRRCSPGLASRFEADSYSAPESWLLAEPSTRPPLYSCSRLAFTPSLSVQPTTAIASSPSGLDLSLDLANAGLSSATDIAAADLAAASLALPPGMTINAALAAGLAACTPAELAHETPNSEPGQGCPQAAKVGTASAISPLLEVPIAGALYVAEPDDPATTAPGAENPLDARFALYLVLRDPARGILVSVPIAIEPDPASGRLRARIEALPQLPFTHLELRFNSGLHAPLATPPGCGPQAIAYTLTPSSGNPPQSGKSTFTTNSDCTAPFAPTLRAGTTTYAAGSSSPFVLELANAAAAPNLESLSLTLPPGLAADLSAATTCPEPATATASCPPDSRLGYARIALGAGPEPLWVPAAAEPDSDVYLAGPDQGAPYSLLISIPAAAGPYDLGRVLLRAPVRLDPSTAQATVSLSDLPQIRDGVPLHYRAIRLVLDRPGFIRNPTSCEPTEISASLSAADGRTTAASSRFQAADCAALPFKPKVSLRLSRPARNAHPSLRASVRSALGEAAISTASFTLPPGELLDLHRLRALCGRGLPAARCPAASRIGSLRLLSPMLPEALGGPIYLREPSKGLPDLLADLGGSGIDLILHGRTTSPAGRLRISFNSLPDIPLTKAEIFLPGGRQGIIANSHDLCAHRHHAAASLAAHNGKRLSQRPKLGLSCRRLAASHRRHRTQSTR